MTDANENVATGGCHCGAVRYAVNGQLRGVVNCHCNECTRLNGNFGSHTKARKSDIEITADEGLAWYEISDIAKRGFCRKCGSSLFWDAYEQSGMGIIAGSLDSPTGSKTIGHIFVSEKADFYEITDNLPQYQKSSEGGFAGDYVE